MSASGEGPCSARLFIIISMEYYTTVWCWFLLLFMWWYRWNLTVWKLRIYKLKENTVNLGYVTTSWRWGVYACLTQQHLHSCFLPSRYLLDSGGTGSQLYGVPFPPESHKCLLGCCMAYVAARQNHIIFMM